MAQRRDNEKRPASTPPSAAMAAAAGAAGRMIGAAACRTRKQHARERVHEGRCDQLRAAYVSRRRVEQ